MADEIASLKVVIEAEDRASAVINGIGSSMNGIGRATTPAVRAADTVAASWQNTGAAVLKGTQRLEGYKQQMAAANSVLTENSAALAISRREYEANKKSISGNISALTKQQQSVGTLIEAKKNEIAALEHANTIVNKGSVAYKDNLKAIDWTKNELAELETQYGNISNSIKSAENTLDSSKQKFDVSSEAVRAASEEYEIYEKNLDAVERLAKAENLQDSGKRIQAVGEGIDTVTKPVQIAAVAVAGLGVASGKAAIDFEDNFAAVKKTVDGTPEQLKEVEKSLISLTTKGLEGRKPVRATTAELTGLASVAGQLGYKADEVAGFAEVMAQMQSATNLGGEEGAKTLARYMNVTQTAHDKTRNLGSAIVYLGNNYETTEAEIASMAMRLGRTGTLVGMSAADTLGFATALSSMGIEAEAGGTAVSKSWTKIDNAVAKGGDNLEAFAKVSGMSAKDFAAKWKTDAAGAFIDFLGGLEQAENLPLLLQDLGITEVRESDALKALALGYDKAKNAVSDANKAWEENTALQKEADAMADTTAGKLATAKNNIVEAGRGIGAAFLPTIADAAQGVSGVAQKFADMSDEEKKAVVNTGAVVVGLGATAKVTSKVVKGVGKATEAFGKLAETGAGKAVISSGAGEAAGAFGSALTTSAAAAAPAAAIFGGYYAVLKGLQTAFIKAREETLSFGESTEDLKSNINEVPAKVKKAVDEMSEMEKINEKNLSHKKQAEEMTDGINGMAEAYKKIMELSDGTSKSAELNKLFDKNGAYKDVLKAYNELVGKDLTAEDLLDGSAIENIKSLAEEWGAAIERNNAGIDKAKEGLRNVAKVAADEAFKNNGYTNIAEALQDGDDGINKVLSSLKAVGDNWGLPFEYTREEMGKVMSQAALLKNGFTDLQSAINSTDPNAINAVFQDFVKFGEAQNLGTDEIREMAVALDMIPEGKHIEIGVDGDMSVVDNITEHIIELDGKQCKVNIDAEGNISILDEATGKTQYLQGLGAVSLYVEADGSIALLDEAGSKVGDLVNNGSVTVSVNADGDVSVIDEATGKAQALEDIGAVELQVNSEGNVEVLDEARHVIATIDGKTAEVILNATDNATPQANTAEEAVNNVPQEHNTDLNASDNASGTAQGVSGAVNNIPQEHNTDLKASDNASGTISSVAGAIANLPLVHTIQIVAQKVGDFFGLATGKDYFCGGLDMVNDQRGVSDPRELIVDHGRAFIPEGRNVILPLSKGAKVYTASQTKAIMAGLGIPHYAEGKENSDAFTAAKENWTHYTKTHAITTTEELEKWVELSRDFTENEKDAADIAEEIYLLQHKVNDELNDRSAAWIDDRTALNDWERFGDNAIAAFDRVRARNLEEFKAGRLTWEEYTDIVSDLGSDMYDARIEQSKKWLDHEEKYRGMNEDDYIAGLDRMAAYTREYYDKGIISYREYAEGLAEIDDERIDKWKDKLNRQMDESLAWIDDRTYFNDWQSFDDDPLAAYERIRERNAAALNEGKLTWEEYTDMMSEAGSALYDGRLDNSRAWLEEQKKYFGMETDDYIAGLNRMKAYTQEYYDKGIITYREYAEGMKDINHDIRDAAAEAYDDMLDKQSEYISELEKKFSDQESELRSSWEVEDRAVDMADLEHQLAIFEGAVTDRGQEQYKELLKQYKDAQREEELYRLQVRNNAVIEDLQAEYAVLENAKADYIKGIAENTDIDVGGYVRDITTNISRSSDNTLKTLQDIITAIKNLDFKMEQQNFSDNRTVTIYSADRYDVEYMAGLGG